jgi:integrase
VAQKQRKTPGMRERSPGVWELIVESGRDPVTGKRRQVSRIFRGGYAAAKKARAELLVDAAKGRHTGTRATVNNLFDDWVIELRRKGRSPNTVHGYEQVYRRNIAPMLGSVPVTKVTTKMLTDLYGAHQQRGLAPRSVYQVHACVSSMMTQACRWGWRDSNPAQWAEPPSIPNDEPVVPTPDEVTRLLRAAEDSRRPEMARAIFVSATTGLRRAELCALRRDRDLDADRRRLRISTSISVLPGQPVQEVPTKNRRIRSISVDALTLSMLQSQVALLEQRAALAGCALVEDPYLFTDSADGSRPWKPNAITQYFRRLRERVGLDHLNFHSLRKFMETYGQDLGFSPAQVAMRAGHDPSVAARHYTGSVEETDRALAEAVAGLLTPPVADER